MLKTICQAKDPKRILIANRGEIAIRIAKAIRELGHIAIGVWTEYGPDELHLEFCHEWVKLEGSNNKETYLNQEQWMSIIKEHQVDMVHPGYGLLSENHEFAFKVRDVGVTFIGPSPEVIKILGDKAASKQIAKEANVPTIPGSPSEVKTLDEATHFAKEIGFPILLKATAGGGGRGIRICNNVEDVETYYELTKREALKAFGYDGLLVEKYITGPKHIEVQVLGDHKGNVFHFFERECSVQRKHQKIVEEAPSPFIGKDEKLRQAMCETAVNLAKSVHYQSAGTVEFIMDDQKNFYFLEMNTRIQVEHPITEEITGFDLLKGMIQVALAEDLPIKSQKDIQKIGHAIECRICVEDPVTMRPTLGHVTALETQFPQGARFDHCLYPSMEVSPDFDSMVGKLITKGFTREDALHKMEMALQGLFIEGIRVNKELHLEIINHPKFLDGSYTTKFMDEEKVNEKISTDFHLISACTRISLLETEKMGL